MSSQTSQCFVEGSSNTVNPSGHFSLQVLSSLLKNGVLPVQLTHLSNVPIQDSQLGSHFWHTKSVYPKGTIYPKSH